MSASDRKATGGKVHHFSEAFGGNAAENYERYFVPAIAEPLANRFLENAALRRGERVLDVACGTGIVARLAAERVGKGGAVTGIDVNPGMLAVARSVTPGDLSIAWHQANAEELPLPDEAFDVVLSQLSLQFVDDKVAALREMRRVLVPGGRVLVNVPGRVEKLFAIMADALATHIDPRLAGFVLHVFSLSDPEELRRLMTQAGFRDVSTSSQEYPTLRLPPPADWLWQYVCSTPLAEAVQHANDDQRTALERDVVARWQEFVDDGGMIYWQAIVDGAAHR